MPALTFLGVLLTTGPAFAVPPQTASIVKQTAIPMTAPLFLENDAYTSKLYLVNSLQFSVQADVTLYDLSGAILTKKQLYLEANSRQTAEIKNILSAANLYAQVGSVQVLTPQNESAVLGQVSITRSGTNKAYLDEELSMPDPAGFRILRGVVDSSDISQSSPVVAITNTSGIASQTLHVSCLPSNGETIIKTISLQPKQTRLIQPCEILHADVLSADAIDGASSLKSGSGQGASGISITTDGPAGELAAFGFAVHNDRYGRYLGAMNFSDTGALQSPSFVFNGVPIGTSSLLPSSAYTPQVAVTNFSTVAQTIEVSLATTTGGTSRIQQVAAFTMPPNSSRLVELTELSGDRDWQNSFIVKSTGQPGDVMAKMAFKAAGLLPNIELLPKDAQHRQNFGDHPWSVENGTRSTLLLYNHSSSVRTVTVRVGSGTDIWLKMYDLQPNETRSLYQRLD